MNAKLHIVFALVAIMLVGLTFTSATPVSADSGGWEYIQVSPTSGHWNYPDTFTLVATEDTTVSWTVACAYAGDGCNRQPEYGTHTFIKGESIEVGWGHQCHSWQLDPDGRAGFIAEPEPWLCPTATPVKPTSTPTSTRLLNTKGRTDAPRIAA